VSESRRLIYQVAVGEGPAFYEPCMASVERYAGRIGAEYLCQREPILKIAPLKSARSTNALRLGYLPIYEKENAFSYLGERDRVLILDADIYVKDSAPDIFEASCAPFGGVLERDMPLTPAYAEKVAKHSEGQFSGLLDVDWKWDSRGAEYYNMGLMLLDKSILPYLNGETPEQFIRRPEFERFVNGEGHWKWSTDQTLLNWWVKKSGMRTCSLDWRWNALYGACRDVSQAYFVHFFLSAKLPQGGREIPKIIGGLE
jgi:hypothetical protein